MKNKQEKESSQLGKQAVIKFAEKTTKEEGLKLQLGIEGVWKFFLSLKQALIKGCQEAIEIMRKNQQSPQAQETFLISGFNDEEMPLELSISRNQTIEEMRQKMPKMEQKYQNEEEAQEKPKEYQNLLDFAAYIKSQPIKVSAKLEEKVLSSERRQEQQIEEEDLGNSQEFALFMRCMKIYKKKKRSSRQPRKIESQSQGLMLSQSTQTVPEVSSRPERPGQRGGEVKRRGMTSSSLLVKKNRVSGQKRVKKK